MLDGGSSTAAPGAFFFQASLIGLVSTCAFSLLPCTNLAYTWDVV
jgi:hypothetical protein